MFNKKRNNVSGTCLWVNEIGVITPRVFIIINSDDKEHVILDFGNKETYKVKRQYVRVKRIMIFKTASGKIIPQDPDKWSKINLKECGIKQLPFNQLNFSIQESRSAQRRWILPKGKLDKLIPLFKLLFVMIAIGVIAWSAFKFSTYALEMIFNARNMDCSALITKMPSPISALQNATNPIGV